jgi:hypothetical protein
MSQVKLVSEEFMYCDPECIYDAAEIESEYHPCHMCDVADILAASDAEIREIRHGH